MSTEIELKLELSPKAAGKLARHPVLAGLATQKQQLLNTYYDTAGLELHARRIAVRFRKKGRQWLSTVKTAEPASGGLAMRSEWETEATPGHFDFSHVDHRELRSFLEDRQDALEPVFTTDFRRQVWQVPFGDSLIELAIDRGAIESRGRHARICEIELELMSGRIEDIFALSRRLQHDIDLRPAIASKAERGYNLFLDRPPQPFLAEAAPISATMTPVEAFRSIALGCLEHFQRNEAGLLASDDPEFIHQAHLALRRLRSAIKLFAPVLPKPFVRTYGRSWKMLAKALGEARHWDVFIGETLPPITRTFPNDPAIQQVTREARRRLRRARKSAAALLEVREYPHLVLEFTAATYTLHDTSPAELRELAHQRIAEHSRTARKLARHHADQPSPERHRMRIALTRLRDSLEFFRPLLPERHLARYLKAFTQLQDELGAINDHVTAAALLAEMRRERKHAAILGWLSGRHDLLVSQLPNALTSWLEQRLPVPRR